MSGIEIVNAKITSTKLGNEEGRCLTCWLFLEFGCGGQGFGGYVFDKPVKNPDGKFIRREGVAWGMEYIGRVLDTVGVEFWEKLPGTHVRIRRGKGMGGSIEAIGHIIKDKWFSPSDLDYLKSEGGEV